MGTNKQCVKAEPQCIHRGQICGCAGCLTQSCCGGAHCLDVGGQGGKKYCVNTGAASFAEENSTEFAESQAVNVLENSTGDDGRVTFCMQGTGAALQGNLPNEASIMYRGAYGRQPRCRHRGRVRCSQQKRTDQFMKTTKK